MFFFFFSEPLNHPVSVQEQQLHICPTGRPSDQTGRAKSIIIVGNLVIMGKGNCWPGLCTRNAPMESEPQSVDADRETDRERAESVNDICIPSRKHDAASPELT